MEYFLRRKDSRFRSLNLATGWFALLAACFDIQAGRRALRRKEID
jgi:hypothetical protein